MKVDITEIKRQIAILFRPLPGKGVPIDPIHQLIQSKRVAFNYPSMMAYIKSIQELPDQIDSQLLEEIKSNLIKQRLQYHNKPKPSAILSHIIQLAQDHSPAIYVDDLTEKRIALAHDIIRFNMLLPKIVKSDLKVAVILNQHKKFNEYTNDEIFDDPVQVFRELNVSLNSLLNHQKITNLLAVVGKKHAQIIAHDEQVYAPIEAEHKTRQFTPKSFYPIRERNEHHHYLNSYDDAAFNTGAFPDIITTIHGAMHAIFICGWHLELAYDYRTPLNPIESLGELLIRKAIENPNLCIAMLIWGQAPEFSEDITTREGYEYLDMLAREQFKLRRGLKSLPNIQFRLVRPAGMFLSHHQKYILADDEIRPGVRKMVLYYGGLDLHHERIDNHEHRVADEDYNRGLEVRRLYATTFQRPQTDELPLPPRTAWRDTHCKLIGPAVLDYLDDFKMRWDQRYGGTIAMVSAIMDIGTDDPDQIVEKSYRNIRQHPTLLHYRDLEYGPQDPLWDVQVVRSAYRDNYGFWANKEVKEASIQDALLRAIASAQHFIEIETQYIIGGPAFPTADLEPTNKVVPALVDKIIERVNSSAPFHVWITFTFIPDQGTSHSEPLYNNQMRTVIWMIEALQRELGDNYDWRKNISFNFMAQWHGEDKNLVVNQNNAAHLATKSRRNLIYVHTKSMNIDDQLLITGSHNLNGRSLAGHRDSEIAIVQLPGNGREEACKLQAEDFRMRRYESFYGPDFVKTYESGLRQNPEILAEEMHEHAISNTKNFIDNTQSASELGMGNLLTLDIIYTEERGYTVTTKGLDPRPDIPDNKKNDDASRLFPQSGGVFVEKLGWKTYQ